MNARFILGVKPMSICGESAPLPLRHANTRQTDYTTTHTQPSPRHDVAHIWSTVRMMRAARLPVCRPYFSENSLNGPNESSAYPAKLLLDGAESAQMFYDTPVMRFYIDPGEAKWRSQPLILLSL